MAIGMSNTSSNSRSGGGGVTPAVFVYGSSLTSSSSVRMYNTDLGVNIQGTYQTITYNDTEYTGFYLTGIPNLYSYTVECTNGSLSIPYPITIENVELTMFNGEASVEPWSSASASTIATLCNLHKSGAINLHNYWSVGDTRTVTLPAMSASGVGESHEAQSIELVLMDATCSGFTFTSGGNTPAFIVGMKNSLKETGYMNSSNTNVGGWASCARRTWCNGTFKTAMDTVMPNVFKQFTWKTGKGGKATSGLTSCNDYFALTPEKAIFGSKSYSYNDEAALYNHWTWYQTSSNRIKKVNGSNTTWWEASPYADTSYSDIFCSVYNSGDAYRSNASLTFGIAPFGCI